MEYDDIGRGPEIAEAVREFVDETVLPVEREWLGRGPIPPADIEALRDARARDGDLRPAGRRGVRRLGLGFREMLPVFEEAGRSLLGPTALRCAAPDEGNMHTLEIAATDAQKERWLRPLAAGDRLGVRDDRADAGRGSDPKMLATTAEKDGDEWVIDGHKWWTTGGVEANLLLVFARTDQEAHPYAGCSVILVPADADGVEVVRNIPHLGEGLVGTTHAEIRFDDVRVPVENTLGEENEGFTLVQQRLGPARLTHCMRYAGMADRALDIATAYLSEREGFGEPLGEAGAAVPDRRPPHRAPRRAHDGPARRRADRRRSRGAHRGRDGKDVRGERDAGGDRRRAPVLRRQRGSRTTCRSRASTRTSGSSASSTAPTVPPPVDRAGRLRGPPPRSLRPSRGSASSTKSRVDSSGHSSLPSSWNTSNSSGSVPNLRTFVTTELRRVVDEHAVLLVELVDPLRLLFAVLEHHDRLPLVVAVREEIHERVAARPDVFESVFPVFVEPFRVELELEQREEEVLLVGDQRLSEHPVGAHPPDRLVDGDVRDVDIVFLGEEIAEPARGELRVPSELLKDDGVPLGEVPVRDRLFLGHLSVEVDASR